MSRHHHSPARRRSRRAVLGAAACAVLLAACGGDDSSTGSTATTVTTAAVGGPATTAAASTDVTNAPDGSGPAAEATRDVADLHGTVTVPADPQRVVVMEDQTLGNLLAIGFPLERVVGYPLGIGGSFANSPELADVDTSTFTSIGEFAEPNLETIAALRPDLIVTAGIIGDEFYDAQWESLRQLGVPVFVVTNGYTSFDEAMTMLADTGRAVNREAQAATVEADLRARVESLTADVAASDVPPTGYIRINRQDNTLYEEASPWLTLLGVPGPRPSLEEYGVSYADELLADALSGYELLFVAERVEGGDFLAKLEANPLWATLEPVQSGAVHVVSENTWKAYSAPAINWILDDIERVLLP